MTDVRKTEDDHVARFIARLRKLADDEDRGALAALRTSLQDRTGMAAAACPHVVPFLPPSEDLYRDRAFFLIGALFALHPDPGGENVSLGHAFRAINTDQEGAGAGDNESLRRRFVALLDADAEDLPNHLRHAVSLARSKQKPLGWERLLRDVLAWRGESRRVQRRLAREFWNGRHDALEPEGEISR
ncbi:type I-E CRISPR-associated protein Cse2/CasB [Sorangium cellulosum]|uniref:type I-E CRISPR-associated protein Cse2/CasB n=1 Tax=Sorangium cellulosum TaxID=56 RepID=UPI003D9A6271